MSRVNDALARARAAGDGRTAGTLQYDGAGSGLTTADLAGEVWPAEGTPVAPVETGPAVFDVVEDLPAGPSRVETTIEAPGGHAGGRLMMTEGIDDTSVEQYRRLAARLYLAQAERGTRLVMVTSALAGEGKTLSAANLALTLSESYRKRVLLIDADLRRPGVHEIFGVPNVAGLNDGVRSDQERKVPVIRLSEHLSVLTAGRPDPDPMSVLASDRMRRILAEASSAFEWVIIDTPPVALLSDAHLLATLVDSVVLVVEAGVTPLQAVKTAAEAVGRDRILGVLLNRAPEVGGVYSYRYGAPVHDVVPGR